MKQNTLSLLSILLSFIMLSGCSSSTKSNKIIGKWATDPTISNQNGSFTFKDNNIVSFSVGNNLIDGEGFQANGKSFKLHYDVDYNKTPIEVTVTSIEQGGDNTKENFANCIIRFNSDTEMEMMANFEGQKFMDFDPTDKAHYMKLIKQ